MERELRITGQDNTSTLPEAIVEELSGEESNRIIGGGFVLGPLIQPPREPIIEAPVVPSPNPNPS